MLCLDPLHQLKPVHLRHQKVREHNVGGFGFDHLQTLSAVDGNDNDVFALDAGTA